MEAEPPAPIKVDRQQQGGRVRDSEMTVVEHDAKGQPTEQHALPFKFGDAAAAFKGVEAVAAVEGLCNPRGFVIVDKHQRSPGS